jgi:hypothetical protein
MKTSPTQRLYAALCFMLAGGIPGVCMILYDLARFDRLGTTLEFLFFWYIIVPAFLAALSGFLFGADILNPDKVRSARQAGVRGLLVSLAAWLAFVPILSAIAGSNWSFLHMFFLVLVFGTVIFGWLIGGVGIATGLLLYRLRRPHQAM